jgi:signal transduction histidine kinase
VSLSRPLNFLLVEDSPDDAELIVRELKRQGFRPNVLRVQSGAELERALADPSWDLVVSDHNLPGFSSRDALRVVKTLAPDLPFIVVSGSIGEEYAVEAMRSGASDFVVKTKLDRLAPAVERELREAAQRAEQRRVEAALAETEERFRQAQKLEAIGRLAGGVAHDFNNLLTAILGFSDLVLTATPDGDPRRSDLEQIKLAGTRAVDLTRQLLAFSRRQVVDHQVLDIGVIVADVVRLLQRVIGEDIRIETSLEPGAWPVLADRTQIEQILMNLAVNARDAMTAGGTLRIGVENVEITPRTGPAVPAPPGAYVLLTVADTGHGIPEDVRPRIFEPFFTTKEPGRGTGLGLSTVYGIVNQSGGVICLDSIVHQGTTFRIYLPRTTAGEHEAAAPTATIAHSTGREQILLVEDETAVRELAARVLVRAGYRVTAVSSAAAAIDTLARQTEPVDLLLTDVVMPGMSGPALVDLVQERYPGTRVLYMSGFSEGLLSRVQAQGELKLLEKPFTPATLVAKVRDVLGRTNA